MGLAVRKLEEDFSNISLTPSAVWKTPEQLGDIVAQVASSDGWLDRVRLRADQRWYERLYNGPEYDIWVISWLPGQSTGFHDHGDSSGAFVVALGSLEEYRPGDESLAVDPGTPRIFGPAYAHDVRNVSLAPAVSIHAYSPPLDEMNEYELDGSQLFLKQRTEEKAKSSDRDWRVQGQNLIDLHTADRNVPQTIEGMLSSARARLRRLSPVEAYQVAANEGAILVDIRPEEQRAIEGSIPGALTIERNVLEWRLDPKSSARLPVATKHDLFAIVFCSEGYTSSLAAAALQDLGLWRATDIIGGFQAWRIAGLNTVSPIKPVPS